MPSLGKLKGNTAFTRTRGQLDSKSPNNFDRTDASLHLDKPQQDNGSTQFHVNFQHNKKNLVKLDVFFELQAASAALQAASYQFQVALSIAATQAIHLCQNSHFHVLGIPGRQTKMDPVKHSDSLCATRIHVRS